MLLSYKAFGTYFDILVMQDNNWGNRDNEKEDKNRKNFRNHHLESACKTLGITTKQRRGMHLKSENFH